VIEDRIKKNIIAHNLIQENDHIVVGVSGGADSVTLLFILNELKPKLNLSLSVGHLNHKLRGAESDADEVFVKNLSNHFKLPFYSDRKDVREIQEREGGTLEEAARRTRYAFFKQAALALGANKIALAHHRDDQAETILFNMIRGSSFHGLRGIPAIRPLEPESDIKIIRPLLDTTKDELENYLESKKICWRTDQTNFEYHADRNFIRHKVLPVLEEINPSFREHLADLGRQAGAVEEILLEPVQRILPACKRRQDEIRIEQWRIRSLPEIIAGEVIRAMLISIGAGMGRLGSRHFRDIIHVSTSLELPDGWQARIEHGWLVLGPKKTIERNNEIQPLPINAKTRFGRFEFSAQLQDFDETAFKKMLAEKNQNEEWIDADQVKGNLLIRHVKDGDRFCPLGSPGTKKISDFLTDVKAGWAEKPAIVITDDNGIVWLTGWRIDERVRVNAGTKKIIRLRKMSF